MRLTLRGVLFPTVDQRCELDRLMRLQSACMRFSFNRLCEGQSRPDIERKLLDAFPQLNSRYRRGGFFRAQTTYLAACRLVKDGRLKSQKKIVFGGREELSLLAKGKITKKDWQGLRNNQVYSRGDKSKRGNLNLRFLIHDAQLYLRVNIGVRKWIHISAFLPKNQEWLFQGQSAYGVRIIRANKCYELRVDFEVHHEMQIGFVKGAVGVDFNHNTIDLCVTNSQGQLKTVRTIECAVLTFARKGKRAWIIGNLVKRIVRFAKYWNRGLVTEKLHDVARGKSNQHKFTHRKFLVALYRRAMKEGLEVRFVNPAYTSVIGRLKYAPFYHITVHQAAALVIARRGQGLTERLRRLKTRVLEPMEGREAREHVLSRRVHAWCLWRLLGSLPSRKETGHRHFDQSSRNQEVESRRTSVPTIGCLSGDDTLGGEIVIPGSGPQNNCVKRTPQS